MFRRIDVDCFTWSTMHGKISLPVAVQVERSQHATARHRLFKNPGRYWIAINFGIFVVTACDRAHAGELRRH